MARIIFRTLSFIAAASAFSGLSHAAPEPGTRVPVTAWKVVRDQGIIMQKRDFSCGAASVATLLSGYYGLNVSEDDAIRIAGKEAWLSFDDLQRVAAAYGLKAVGLELDFAQLKQLSVPVIVYIDTRAGPHFAVLRGINDDFVWLGDPASGNNYYRNHQFLSYWRTTPAAENPRGKILLVLPAPETTLQSKAGFFQKEFHGLGTRISGE